MVMIIITLSTYRRSLLRQPREDDREKRLRRSRQQRVSQMDYVIHYNYYVFKLQIWDRRSKHVNENEILLWQDVLPSMMSDEETLDGGVMKRHRPDWRSREFTELIDTLDERNV